ncbi:MAG: trigger factor [Bacillota bacterium]
MDVSVEKLEGNQVQMTVTVPPEDVDEAVKKAVRSIARGVNIPGFRKGKAPRRVLEMRFGKEAILAQALEDLIPDAYQRALDKSGIQAIDRPVVDELPDLVEGSPYTFKAKVQVLPEVELGDYRAVRVQKESVEITDEQVRNVINSMRERFAELVSVDKPSLEKGDFADIDFEGSVEGVESEGLSHKGVTLEIGSNSYIPGFEDQLVGMAVGEEREISVKFPDDYHSSELAGKDARFKVKLNDIREKRLPELDDEFAKDVGNYESLDELRSAIKERLESEAAARAEREFEDKVTSEVADRCSVDIPKILVDRTVDRMMDQLSIRLRYSGMTLEQYLQMREMTEQQLRDEFAPEAEKQVKIDLVLDAVSRAEGIEVTDEDVDQKLSELAEQYSRSVDELKELYEKEDRMDSLKESLRIEKTVAKLKDYASMRIVVG